METFQGRPFVVQIKFVSNSVQTNVNKVKCVPALCDNSKFRFYDVRDALLLEVIDIKM